MKTPKKLYKYFPSERLECISSNLFRFTPLIDFNDPFEGTMVQTGVFSPEELQEQLNSAINECIIEQYNALPSPKPIEFEQFKSLATHAIQTNKETLNSNINMGMQFLQNAATAAWNNIRSSLVGAFCLTETSDNLLMWSHYSSSHSGFVIEFNTSHSYFDQRVSDDDDLRCLQRVIYRDQRPTGYAAETFSFESLITKSPHWAYEKEWRMFMPLENASTTISCEDLNIHLFSIPPDAISAIIFGCRTRRNDEENIKKIINSSPQLEHIKTYKTRPDENHFILKTEPN